MNAQELKNSILMRAVQGKLVPQEPNDEPASILLEKIRAEKEQLMKEKKIKKEPISVVYKDPSDNQHYEKIGTEVRCIEDEIPFEIPESWEWCRLGSILTKLTDGTHSTPHYTEAGIPFISVKDISSGTIDFSNTKHIAKSEHDELYKRCDPKKGDILLTKVGTTGIPVIIDTDEEFSLFVSVALLKYNNELISNNYMKLLLLSPLVQKQCTENTKGVGNKNWVIRDIAKTLIVIPPQKEQERIRDRYLEFEPIISQYDKHYSKLDLLNSNIKENIKKSILQYAIQGKLVPQDPNDEPASVLLERIRAEKEQMIKDGKIKRDKNESYIYRGSDNSYYEKFADGTEICIDNELPFEIPLSWTWCRLSNLGQIIGGGTPSTSNTDFWDGEIPWLTPADMKFVTGKYVSHGERNITQEGLSCSSARLMPKNTLLYSSRAPIGYIAISQNDICTNQGFKSLVLIDNNMVQFLYYCLIQRTDDIKSRASGTTFKEISGTEFGRTIIPLPPKNEQNRITTRLKLILSNI